MSEHYTRNTEHGVLKNCNQCGRLTKHLVFDGRIGRCMEHEAQLETKKQKAAKARRKLEQKQKSLWEE